MLYEVITHLCPEFVCIFLGEVEIVHPILLRDMTFVIVSLYDLDVANTFFPEAFIGRRDDYGFSLLFFTMLWVRWSLVRFRADQLMALCWKYLLPLSLLLVMAAAVYVHYGGGRA